MGNLPTILGPDGAPLEQRGEVKGTPGFGRPISRDEAIRLVETGAAYTPEQLIGKMVGDGVDVEKRMRSQQASFAYAIHDRNRGKPKPTPVTFETLRMIGNRNEWVRAIVKTRKNQIGRTKWRFVPKEDSDTSGGTEKLIESLTRLLKRPSMHGSAPTSRSWRQFIGEVLEDVLILDAGSIEKERTNDGWIAAMYPVDGSTIRPNIDEQGRFYDDAYVQVVDGIVTAKFGMEDLVYIMDNPQTDVRFAGYGLSPLENLIVSVTAELHASRYNSHYFEKGAVPEGILNLGEEASPEDVDAFRLYWMNEIMGRPWAIPIIGGKGVEWVQWRDNNRDMQFMEYQTWLLKKMCAVYQMTPQEVGLIEDVNRSTAESQEGTNESKSIEPILTLLKDYIDVEIVGEHGQGVGDYVEFEWEEEGPNPEEVNAKFQPMVSEGAASRAEWREAQGMDTPDDDVVGVEGLDMMLVDGEPKPLPTKEDTEVMGAKAQQDHEAEQAQQQMDGQGPAADMQWKPGDANDPKTRAAMDAHDQEHGIGPRNNQPPIGKTHDRDPAATRHQDDLAAVFTEKQEELLSGLSEILGLPRVETEELIEA